MSCGACGTPTWSSASGADFDAAHESVRGASDTAREGEQQDEEQEAEHERPVLGVGDDVLVEQDDYGRAQGGPPEIVDAAQDGHDQHLCRLRPVAEVGEHAAVEDAEQPAGEPGTAAIRARPCWAWGHWDSPARRLSRRST